MLFLVAAIMLASLSEHSVQAAEGSTTGVTLLTSTNDGVELLAETSFNDLNLQTKLVDGELYTEISLVGWTGLEKPGEPNLPIFTALIAVPFGVDLTLEITPGPSRVFQLQAPILPGKTQVLRQELDPMLTDPMQVEFDFITRPDTQIYTSKGPYPQTLVQITNDGVLRNQRLVSITFFPCNTGLKATQSPFMNRLRRL